MYVRMCDVRAFTCGRCGLVWSGVVWSGLYFIPPPKFVNRSVNYARTIVVNELVCNL